MIRRSIEIECREASRLIVRHPPTRGTSDDHLL